MVVKHLGDNEWEGESTDPKPTNAAVGARYTAKNTREEFIHVGGGIWNSMGAPPPPPVTAVGPERWYIYRTGTGTTGPYHALNKRIGSVVYTGSSLDEVLDPVLTDVEAGDQGGDVTTFLSSGGHIYIDGTDVYYSLSVGFDGFTIPPYTKIEGPPNARILVRNGYAGHVFRIPSWRQINATKYTGSTNGITISGFTMYEGGTPARNWTGILIEGWAEDVAGNPGGVAGCRIEGTKINDCKTGVFLNQTAIRGWITTSWFEKIYVSNPKWAGFDQELMSGYLNEFANNVFRDCAVQSDEPAGTTGTFPAYGFRNMGHKRCIYDNCCVWDVKNGTIKGNFDSRISEDNLIIGGILADSTVPPVGTMSASHNLVIAGYYAAGTPYPAKYVDGLKNTCIVGDYVVGNQFSKIYIPALGVAGTATLSIEGRKTDSNTLLELVGADDAIQVIQSWYNKSRSERFSFTKGTTTTTLEQIKQTAGGTLRPIIFRMNDVPGGVATEAFRILTSGDIQMGDARNFVLNATTGTKIGTATTQKLGFYNKTPIAQPVGGAATAAATYGTNEQSMIQKLYDMARNVGLLS